VIATSPTFSSDIFSPVWKLASSAPARIAAVAALPNCGSRIVETTANGGIGCPGSVLYGLSYPATATTR
jgi:hypothetical protein